MVARVQRVGESLCVILPQQVIEKLHLVDGSEVEVQPVSQLSQMVPLEPAKIEDQYLTTAQVLELFHETESQHADAYRELAK